jgi:hypothetical protein
VAIARADWDNFETSWDFRDQPLLRPGLKGATLESSWRNWEAQSTAAIRRMQELETENNRLFIAAYGLDDELQPEMPEAQITLARAEARRDMAAFLSCAFGCMMGRYSLDTPGLILANAGDTVEDYRRLVAEKKVAYRSLEIPINLDIPVRAPSLPMEEATVKNVHPPAGQEEATDKNVHPTEKMSFSPDEDNVISILDGDWFPDDITERFKKFLKLTFGELHFDENMRFLEESLGNDVLSRMFQKHRIIFWYDDEKTGRCRTCGTPQQRVHAEAPHAARRARATVFGLPRRASASGIAELVAGCAARSRRDSSQSGLAVDALSRIAV